MTSAAADPAPLVRPPLWPLFLGLLPFLLLLTLVFIPPAVAWIDAHPGWALLVGGLPVLAWLGYFGSAFAKSLDYWFRTGDFYLNRTYGPPVQGHPLPDAVKLLLHRGGILKGYSVPIVLWTVLTLIVVIFGPARSVWNDPARLQDLAPYPLVTAGLFLCLIALTLAGCLYFAWCKACLHQFTTLLILAVVIVVSGFLWLTAPGSEEPPRAEADSLIYPHVFLPLVGLVVVLGYGARLLACRVIGEFEVNHHDAWKRPEVLQRVELFTRVGQPTLTLPDVLRSAFKTPLRQPHLLIFPIAAVVLVVPHTFMTISALITALLTWAILAAAGVHERLNAILDCLRRHFFHGALCVASALVIILAACRFFDVSYVATIANSTSNASLVSFIAAAYVTLWFYKYWTGYVLSERMLAILRAESDEEEQGPGQLRYRIDEPFAGTSVDRTANRFVQVHGIRFAAVGVFRHNEGPGIAWQFYDPLALFETIVARQPPAPTTVVKADGGASGVSHAAEPSAAAPQTTAPAAMSVCKLEDPLARDTKFGLNELRQRMHFYYAVLDGLLVAAVAFFLWGLAPPVKAELSADQQAHGVIDLHKKLFEPADGTKRRAVILYAASGGGTRAALYGAAVLRGLHEIGALADVEACSGVSGGSAAIAHLAIHRPELLDPAMALAWQEYGAAMSAPYIDEVLCGSLEWRVARGIRMGTLLDESLQRHLQKNVPLPHGMKLADAPLGIIFNTTLAGTEGPEPAKKAADPTDAGSRLIVTNLWIDGDTFPKVGYPGAETAFLPYIVVQDPSARLATGAALSANFPPVFPNTAVDLKKGGSLVDRHWVTDGGAAENRGDISLLYVLLRALEREAAGQKRPPPAIQLVIAEASGVSLDFSQDRGLGSIMGASGKFSNQLLVELLQETQRRYQTLKGPSFEVQFVPMPLVLRSRGGVGTHWKMPAFVTLANPRDKEKTLTLRGTIVRQMIMDLFVTDGESYATSADADTQEAWKWVEGTDADKRFAQHRPAWDRLKDSFKKLGYPMKQP